MGRRVSVGDVDHYHAHDNDQQAYELLRNGQSHRRLPAHIAPYLRLPRFLKPYFKFVKR
ncbi:MAG: hypothetical protein AOA65_1011 [Candidatus Bathyarchaeota archaeon BA1]|nr:MAG: hypothetical protein AOA65_1011 [Candidatus Bathyarchaeota archaeon BA1]